MPNIPWRKESEKTDWYSNLRGGFKVKTIPTGTINSMAKCESDNWGRKPQTLTSIKIIITIISRYHTKQWEQCR